MKKIVCSLTSLAALVLAAPLVLAQPTLKPGLWQHEFDLKSQSGQIEAAMEQAKKMLESLPPEQRKMMEEQMAAQGIGLDLQTYSTKVCITETQAAQNRFPEPNENCSQEILEQSDGVFKMRFRCEGNPPVTGEGEMRLLSEEKYQGKVTMDTTINGQSETMTATQTGTWVAADCGSVKPMPNS